MGKMTDWPGTIEASITEPTIRIILLDGIDQRGFIGLESCEIAQSNDITPRRLLPKTSSSSKYMTVLNECNSYPPRPCVHQLSLTIVRTIPLGHAELKLGLVC